MMAGVDRIYSGKEFEDGKKPIFENRKSFLGLVPTCKWIPRENKNHEEHQLSSIVSAKHLPNLAGVDSDRVPNSSAHSLR